MRYVHGRASKVAEQSDFNQARYRSEKFDLLPGKDQFVPSADFV